MITRKQKEEIIVDLKEKFQSSPFIVFVNFHGISVSYVSKLRREIRSRGGEYVVGKKTLIAVAAEQTGSLLEKKQLLGEIGLVFSSTDTIGIAKTLVEFAKKNPDMLSITGGFFEKNWIDSFQVRQFASIPPREVLLAQLMHLIHSPAQNLVGVLSGPMRSFVTVLREIGSKK